MRRTLIAALICLHVGVAGAQAQPNSQDDEDKRTSRLRQNVGRLLENFQGLSDWDTHSGYLLDAMEKAYDRNGWDSEPDQFSLTLIREVNTVPPWQVRERFDKLVEVVSDRYLLDAQQEQKLRVTLIRESNEMFAIHSSRIMQYAVEAIQTRAAGEAFTAEQVARWVKLAEPVFMDGRTRMNAAATRLKAELDPDQQALLQEDLDAANRRMADVEEMSQHWMRGEWQASDWGLEEDPIQVAGEARAASAAPATKPDSQAGRQPTATARKAPPQRSVTARRPVTVNPQPGRGPRPAPTGSAATPAPRPGTSPPETRGPAQPNDPWAQYVERFIRKYKLDEAQQARAWKIYRDVKTRSDKYRGRYAQQIEAARRRTKASEDPKAAAAVRELEAKRDADLSRLFEQLKRRLERLPTRSQRANAEPDDLDKPARKVKKPVNPVENDGP